MRAWNSENSHVWLLGVQNGTTVMENYLVVSYKAE